MNLLPSYDYTKQPRYQRMVILGGKLVASSYRGLFVCNTATMKSHYLPCGNGTYIESISLVHNKIIAAGQGKWYSYNPNENPAIKELTLFPPTPKKSDLGSLQPYGYGDTIYSFSVHAGKISKLLVTDKYLLVVGKINTGGFLNTVSPSGDNMWVHTKDRSFTINGLKTITGYNLTDLVVDWEGDSWLSSFKYGLLLKNKNTWDKIKVLDLEDDEVIECLENQGKINMYGTNKGKIILEDSGSYKIVREFNLPFSDGPVEYIKIIDSSRAIIGSRYSIFMLHDHFKNLEKISSGFSLKGAALSDTSIFLATSSGLFELLNNPLKSSPNHYLLKLINAHRTLAIAYNQKANMLLAANNAGLYEVQNSKLIPMLFKGSPVYGITLLSSGDKLYIAAFNQGVLKADRSGVTRISDNGGWEHHPFLHMKIVKNKIWMLGPEMLKIMDPVTEYVRQDIVVPPLPDADIFNIAFVHNKVAILTSKGIYILDSLINPGDYKVKNYLMRVTVNDRDTSLLNNSRLPNDQNNIGIVLSSPFYIYPDKINFKYRLLGNGDTSWKISEHSERIFRFSSLKPGQYKFEAWAFHSQFGSSDNMVSFNFTILPHWYETVLFESIFLLLLLFTVYWFARGFFKARLEKQRIIFERKMAIQEERERISAEIHDDLGAGLSAVRLLAELTGEKTENPETKSNITRIYSSVSDLSSKIRELIWGLNIRNDSLEKLIMFIRDQAIQLFENSPIRLLVNIPEAIPDVELTGHQRTDIYLSVKEALHNSLKHSGAENVVLDFTIEKKFLHICVKDDGRGLNGGAFNQDGNGIINMKKRISRLRGAMDTRNSNGLTILFKMPINYN
jgi:signal transduction histidine kinase